ncbi:MAG: sterol desaturase family protein [Alphaproteobacteria bacterium]
MFGSEPWKGRKHYLDKMTLAELAKAYFTYPAIQTYVALLAISVGVTVLWAESIAPIAVAVSASCLIYALVWYFLHRFVLHGRFLYRSSHTAALWKRVHYDHHQDPHDLGVLFGAVHTTLPTVFIVTAPMGWLIGGPAGSAAAFAAGLFITCFYEFCHCIQHLAYTPRRRLFQRVKKLHLAHHFHNEQGNFGITSFLWDHVFGTYYPSPPRVPRSATVFNLGYTDTESGRFPWVAELSGSTPGDMPVKEDGGGV